MRTLLAVMAIWVLFAPIAAADPVQNGVVFADLNADGVRNAGEAGLSGVLVSNSVDVVATDRQGRYAVATPSHGEIFVIQPPGYQVATDETNTPRFFRLFRGAPPALGYPVPPASEPAPDSLNFALTRGGPGSQFTALLFADPQATTDRELTFVRDDFLAPAAQHEAAFAVALGDLINDDLALLPRYRRLTGTLGMPVWAIAGNHELNFQATEDAQSLETFALHYGPARYAFMVGDAVFVALDNVTYLGRGTSTTPNPRGIGAYRGEIGDAQLSFVRNLLAAVPQDRLVVIALHIPLEASWDGETVNTRDREDLLALLCERQHVVVLAGHMHAADHRYLPCPAGAARDTVHQHTLAAVSGSWWSGPMDDRGIPTSWQTDGAPNGYYLFHVEGTQYTMQFVPQAGSSQGSLRISFDTLFYRYSPWAMRDYPWGEIGSRALSTDQLSGAQVYVNLFDGGPRSRVFVRIGDRAEQELTRSIENDPFAEELFFRAEGVRLNLTASPSTHLWKGPLPQDLPAGVHIVTARAIDEFGVEHHTRAILEVLSPQ
ncbi:MAG: calcineurin-like phosphoesterase C-terminal domain-containing protein [Alphaproteobacteria bacterium]|nr:calcineurin-like phosphoesterase C-terminal domain-containing protein [Alphaproteobacteria bacterium]